MATKTCSVKGCPRPRWARGWCGTHYRRWAKNGSPHAVQIKRTRWTQAEDYFILDTPDLTSTQQAQQLGRSRFSVEHRRKHLQSVEPTKFATRKGRQLGEAWEVGQRRLLCKTCPECGLLLDAAWFAKNTGNTWKPRCRSCASRYAADNAERYSANRLRLERFAADRATRRGTEYTDSDLNVLADPALSLFQMALKTRRTIAGVEAARQRYLPEAVKRHNPRLGDPREAQWVIELSPNVAPLAVAGP